MKAEEIRRKLEDHGIQPTAQRCVIAGYLFETDSHPTAEEVDTAVKDLLPGSLSRATVYNTLNLLVEKGLISELSMEPGKVRYDALKAFHHHFVDIKTGRIIDIEPEDVFDQEPEIKLPENFKYTDYQITFYGEIS